MKSLIVLLVVVSVFGATEYGIIDSTVREANFSDPYIESSKDGYGLSGSNRPNLDSLSMVKMVVYRDADTLYLWWLELGIDSVSVQDKSGAVQIVYRGASCSKARKDDPHRAPYGEYLQRRDSVDQAEKAAALEHPEEQNLSKLFDRWMNSLSTRRKAEVVLMIAVLFALVFFGIAQLWDSVGYLVFLAIFLAILLFFLGGCTPYPVIMAQRESIEQVSGGALINQYRDPSGIWVFPTRGPVEGCSLSVYQDTSEENKEGRWLPASVFFNRANLWYHNGAAYVADYDSLLWKRNCTKWKMWRRTLSYGAAK